MKRERIVSGTPQTAVVSEELSPLALPFDLDAIQRQTADRSFHAEIAKLTRGVSPTALGLAYIDWLAHLSLSPGKQAELVSKAAHKWLRLLRYAARAAVEPGCARAIEPLPYDRRFSDKAWNAWPFNIVSQGFLLTQQWWHTATTNVSGVSAHHEAVVSFVGRQLLDMMSPSNFLLLNPEVLQKTIESGGKNLQQGLSNWFEDVERLSRHLPPVGAEAYRPGEHVAVTPGKVVFRNRIMELIQYAPETETVYPEPVLIVPAWIMKYYILDLSPKNSLVRYLVERGHTVFVISWKNPGPDDRDLSMEDYINDGAMAAIDAVSTIVPDQKIHAAGYCLGGTLLSIAAAAMARDGDTRLKSMTLFAAQTDFTEAGELTLFIDDAALSLLDDLMWSQGYLETRQMAGTFQLLRSNNLIWSRLVYEYLMGERPPMNDLMAWNADGTRMPYRMHSEYLHAMFLNNDLAEGRFKVGNEPVAIEEIRVPIFAVSTQTDHVAPWRSVFKIQLLTQTEVTFVLTSGGHNAGIVSEPGHPHRTYRIATRKEGAVYRDPDRWMTETPVSDGSWWPEWQAWLAARSGARVPPPAIGAPLYRPLEPAPGSYVLQA